MKILFAMDRRVNAGSIHAVANYVRAGDECGHKIALYGHADPRFPDIRFAVDVDDFDRVVLIVESSLGWMSGLRMPALLTGASRSQRAIVDADAMYDPVTCVQGYDRNHANEGERANWLAHYRLLADLVFQPTTQPSQPEVVSLPFYGYDTASVMVANDAPAKRFDVIHVGHNWWRGQELRRLLPALEHIRSQLDGVCFLGSWWTKEPAGASELGLEAAFTVDRDKLNRLRIDVQPAVPYTEVVRMMSTGRVNLMTQRPLFRQLRILTSKYFEVFCADTVPLVLLDPNHAESVYGPAGRELSLHDDIEGKLLDALASPQKYREIVNEVRRHLTEHHSYPRRVEQLVSALTALASTTGGTGCG